MNRLVSTLQDRLPLWGTLLIITVGLMAWLGTAFGGLPVWAVSALDALGRFAVVFLGIFIEAAPFLLMGTLASGIVDEFVDRETLAALIPRSAMGGALAGSLVGLFFPVCECGVVPFSRRLMRKGVPAPAAVAVLLAAPVLNPIVIAGTWAAFGPGPVLWGRLGATLLIAVTVGAVVGRSGRWFGLRSADLLKSRPVGPESGPEKVVNDRLGVRTRRVMVTAVDEFFEMGRFLVLGALLAALLQTIARQADLLAIGQGPVLSVVVMVALAALLSVCSTVDAFIALAFVGTFSTGSILAFLVFGPMVDIKSTLMYLRVFRGRTVVALVVLPLLLSVGLGILVNLFL